MEENSASVSTRDSEGSAKEGGRSLRFRAGEATGFAGSLFQMTVCNNLPIYALPVLPPFSTPVTFIDRSAVAANIPLATKINPVDGAEMVWIPAGTFQIKENSPASEVTIRYITVTLSGFWMYKTPVTVAQFRKYCEEGAFLRDFGSDYNWTREEPEWGWQDDHPMVNVCWQEADAYAKWAGVRLPTEAQWEYAARGGLTGKRYPWGHVFCKSKLHCSEKINGDVGGTAAVGSYAANGYGLYDMAGNVWEWCADKWKSDYHEAEAGRGANPIEPANVTYHRLRGGSWYVCDSFCFWCTHSLLGFSTSRQEDNGFRCVSSDL